MLTVAEAFERIVAAVARLEVVVVPLPHILGMTLAEDVAATEDSPPFDKALMDGYAVRADDVASGVATLKVIEVVTAGKIPTRSVGPGEATQIMTGAPLPDGADLVVKVEETHALDDGRVRISTSAERGTRNVLLRGTSVQAGDVVLKSGIKLNASRIGALAELGRAAVSVYRRPTVAIIATGDELVAVNEMPGKGQIRNSNQSMLVAQIQAAGAVPVALGIARDDRDELRAKIQLGLKCDLLLLSGGVSAGTLDLVPGQLAAEGVREVFHKVEMKPGKPVWFGLRDQPGSTCYVFGLPGNPVSSLVCCELFVRTSIRRMMGEAHVLPQSIPAKFAHEHQARADRPTYHPADLSWTAEGPVVKLVAWHGSSDLCGTVAANAMVLLPGDARYYHAGDVIETFAW